MNPPPAFGPYRVLHQIGSGVLGPVFRTYDPQRDRLVAIKAFKLDLVPEGAARLAEALRRMADEPVPHPALVRPIDAGLEGTVPFLALEYASGDSLDVTLRQSGATTLDRALPLLAELAQAMDHAWAAGFGHGALHPRDVFAVPGSTDVRVTGLGIVAALESVGIKPPVRRPYSAPERVAGQPWDARADVFSLSVIAYELLTGRRAAGPGDPGEMNVTDLTAEGNSEVRRVLSAGLAERPEDRFASATALVDALAAVKAATAPQLPVPAGQSAGPPGDLVVTDVATPPVARKSRRTSKAALAQLPLLPADEPTSETPDPDSVAEPVAEPPLEDVSESPSGSEPDVEPETEPVPEPAPETAVVLARDEPPVEVPSFVVTPRRPLADFDLRTHRVPAPPLERPQGVVDELTSPSPASYPWTAIAAVALAGIVLGGVIGYAIGLKRGTAVSETVEVARVAPDAGLSESAGGRDPVSPVAAETPPAAAGQSATRDPMEVAPPAPAVARGRLVIQSEPAGASVTLDGRGAGQTPVTLTAVALGAHTVEIARAGYVSHTERVTLSATSPSRTIRASLGRAPAATVGAGTVFVDSRPRGARVRIDGRSVGKTPLSVPELPSGPHRVQIDLAGYKSVTSTATVVAGGQTRVAVTLERVEGVGTATDRRK